jgi:hypothetical protein
MSDAKSVAAEKLAHLQHEEWLASRPKVLEARTARALKILDRPTGHSTEDFDRIPAGYRSVRGKYVSKKAPGR